MLLVAESLACEFLDVLDGSDHLRPEFCWVRSKDEKSSNNNNSKDLNGQNK